MANATNAPTANDLNALHDRESQLSMQTITNTLRYLVPPSDDGIPAGLLSKQLQRRHHFLDIHPNDQTSYFCLNPDHPAQDPKFVLAALYQLSGRNAESLVGQTAYSTDGESILAHVIVGSQVQACFVWEIIDANPQNGKIGEWRYLDVKPLPLPRDAFETVQEAQAARKKPTSNPRVVINDSSEEEPTWDDSYWSQYDNVAPSVSNGLASVNPKAAVHLTRTGSGGGLSFRSNSPRREDAYWDRYGYSEDEEEDGMISLAAAAPAVQPNLRISNPGAETRHLIQPTSRRPSEFDPEDLSKALSSHLQTDITLSTELSERNSPPFSEPNLSADADDTSPMFESSMLGLSDVAVNDDITPAPEANTTETYNMKEENIEIQDAVRGLFRLWQKARKNQGSVHPNSQEEKDIFMSVVSKTIANI